MSEVNQCPIETAFHRTSLHLKWTLTIVRDLMLGLYHFSDYLKTNEGLTPKVLSSRLKDMEAEGLITKDVVSTTPVEVEYHLTEKGWDLKKILFEFSMFGAKHYSKQVFGQDELDYENVLDIFGGGFMIDPEDIERLRRPKIVKI